MKRFVGNLLCVLLSAGAILLALTGWQVSEINRVSWKLRPDTHMIVFGPSTTGSTLSEEYLSRFQNLSRNASYLSQLVSLLPKLLDENPNIDTVLINHGRFQLILAEDKENLQLMRSIREALPFIYSDLEHQDWKEILGRKNFYGALFTPNLEQMITTNYTNITDFVNGHTDVLGCNLENHFKWYDRHVKEHGGTQWTKEWILKNCSSNHRWTLRAMQICREHGVVPVLFFSPVYNYDRWIEIDGLVELMKDYPPQTLIADYEDFAFPDSTYFLDVHHLNGHGAKYISSHIDKNGLQVQSLQTWLAAHE